MMTIWHRHSYYNLPMRLLLTFTFISIAILTLTAAEAMACMCPSVDNVRDDYARAAVAVRARAVRTETEASVTFPLEMLPRRGARWVVMMVRSSYKGDVRKEETLRVRQSFFEGCEPFIRGTAGVDYLLFLEELPAGEGLSSTIAGRRFRVLPCSRSKETKADPGNVRIVERLARGKN